MTMTIGRPISPDAYRMADAALQQGRESWRHAEIALMATRDAALRQMIGPDRGGLATVAKTLGISVAQVLRLLDDGLTRTVHSAMAAAGIGRSGYTLMHQRGSRSIGMVLLDRGLTESTVVTALAHDGLRLVERRLVWPDSTDAARWSRLKNTKRLAQLALTQAGISSRAYRLVARRGDEVARLRITQIMEGLDAQGQFVMRLQEAGFQVEVDAGVLLISTPIEENQEQERELVFAWQDA